MESAAARFVRGAIPALFLGLAPGLFAAVTFSPAQPNVEQTVSFTLTPPSTVTYVGPATWSFGDGTTVTGGTAITHAYLTAKSFTVYVEYRYQPAAGGPIQTTSESALITAVERRRVTFAPGSPQAGQSVSFTAQNFLSTSVRWDFGDGSPSVLGGASAGHVFTLPGTFTASARDLGGSSTVAVTASVTVGFEAGRRSLQVSPLDPLPGQAVAFRALAFYTTDIRWDFGDGTPPVSGGPEIVHAFAAPGTYVTRAWDWDGTYGPPVEATVSVFAPAVPEASSFRLFYLQLRFADGKAYTVVPRNAPDLRVFADLKHEGTGMLRAEWLVDGAPFRFLNRSLRFGGDITVDSGIGPGLPTQIPGLHEVSLRLLEPEGEFRVPVIRYYVAAGDAVRPSDLRGIELSVERVEGLDGVRSSIAAGRLEVPAGRYVILEGRIDFDLARPLRFALLRVHVGTDLVDQQLLRDLRPGDRRGFQTSLRNPAAGTHPVYITVYGLEDGRAELVHFSKLTLSSPEK